MDSAGDESIDRRQEIRWILAGMRQVLSVPAAILMFAFIGFAGFAKESGITLLQAFFMTATIWALPAKVVLVAAIGSGASILSAFGAVTLSSVRLMPMVSALIPELRGPRTRTATLILLSHFIAVTAWVVAMGTIDRVPRRYRTAYFGGFAVTLTTINTCIVAIVYVFSTDLPEAVLGVLFFLTPIYFLTSLWATARDRVVKIAMVAGLLLGPAFYEIAPQFDLLLAGAVGGVVAFLIALKFPDADAGNTGEEA